MSILQPSDDSDYLTWLIGHPDGYVINTEPGGRGYIRLHRARCDTIRTRRPFIGPSYVKVCSTTLLELDEWSIRRRGAPAQRCGAYQCWPRRAERVVPDPDPLPGLDPAPVLEALARDRRLRVFLGHGAIETIPAKRSRRLPLLDLIAQAFEPGVRYPEQRVSRFLGTLHPDYASLRRYLVDEELLTRSDGQYWRSGGTVPTASGD